MKTMTRFTTNFLIGITLGLAIASAEPRYTPTVQKTMKSVVKIRCIYLIPVTDPKTKKVSYKEAQSTGAGVIISNKGHILTCAHVISGSPTIIDIRLQTSPTTYMTATVLRRDFHRDLALLKLKTSSPTFSVSLASESPNVGEEVIAIGHPYLYEWSVTAGIISGKHRDGLAVNLLQTDTAINPGNSGGPLFNLDGQVVGINESGIMQANNMGFAVPVEEIREFLSVFDGLGQVF